MQRRTDPCAAFLLLAIACLASAQTPVTPASTPASNITHAGSAPLPDPKPLLLEVERNDKRFEALRKDYTYHVHLVQQEFKKDGGLKKTEVIDSESFTLKDVRVNRVIARDGRPLTTEEQAKESERIDKQVAKARDRESKAAGKGEDTDGQGNPVLSAARILELGTFTHERRVDWNGRPTIVLDYAGDPNAKTHSQIEGIVRDLVGTVWIDEADGVLVRGEGHFLNDFKIGGGLLADVRKNTSFVFENTHLGEGVWLPARASGQGSIRLLLFAGLNGSMEAVTSDYRRFRTSATILPGEVKVDANGNPEEVPATPGPVSPPQDPAKPPPQR